MIIKIKNIVSTYILNKLMWIHTLNKLFTRSLSSSNNFILNFLIKEFKNKLNVKSLSIEEKEQLKKN